MLKGWKVQEYVDVLRMQQGCNIAVFVIVAVMGVSGLNSHHDRPFPPLSSGVRGCGDDDGMAWVANGCGGVADGRHGGIGWIGNRCCVRGGRGCGYVGSGRARADGTGRDCVSGCVSD